MTYKKWFFLTTITAITIYLLILISYILIDPEIVFNKSITEKKFGYTKYYSKYQFKKLLQDKYSLVFGTSRSQKVSSCYQGNNLLNFHNIYGEPREILNFLLQLNQKQLNNIKNIYILVSLKTMRENGEEFINYKSNTFFDKLLFILPLSPMSVKYLIRDIKYNILKSSIYYWIDDDGSLYVNDKNQSVIITAEAKKQKLSYNIDDYQNAIQTLLEIDKFCKKHSINIKYYTPTNADKFFPDTQMLRDLWLKLFQGGIDNFYGLYYIDGVSNNVKNDNYLNFTDSNHLNYNMMNKIFKNIVVQENKDYLIKNESELEDYIRTLDMMIIKMPYKLYWE